MGQFSQQAPEGRDMMRRKGGEWTWELDEQSKKRKDDMK